MTPEKRDKAIAIAFAAVYAVCLLDVFYEARSKKKDSLLNRIKDRFTPSTRNY